MKKSLLHNLSAFITWLSSLRHLILNFSLSILQIFDIYHYKIYLFEATPLLIFLLDQIFIVQALLYLHLSCQLFQLQHSDIIFQKPVNLTLINKVIVSSGFLLPLELALRVRAVLIKASLYAVNE